MGGGIALFKYSIGSLDIGIPVYALNLQNN